VIQRKGIDDFSLHLRHSEVIKSEFMWNLGGLEYYWLTFNFENGLVISLHSKFHSHCVTNTTLTNAVSDLLVINLIVFAWPQGLSTYSFTQQCWIKVVSAGIILLSSFWGLWGWGLNSGLCTCKAGALPWATSPVHFALVILEMRVSQTLCLGWPQTSILPLSTS
jgi:hypothetical protein